MTLNGRPLTRSFITHGEIMGGGELRFTMGSSPDRNWATLPADRPYSMATATAATQAASPPAITRDQSSPDRTIPGRPAG